MVDVGILLFLILVNGTFAMAEIGLVTARRARLREFTERGDAAAAQALALAQDPNRFLSTIQVGITSIGVLNGIVGEAALSPPLAAWLQGVGVGERAAGYLATGVVVLVITYFSIVLGELVPKRLGQSNPEAVARLVARPMEWLARVARPFVNLLSGSTELVLRLLGASGNAAPAVTEEEIRSMLVEGANAGVIEKEEHEMVRNVFRLDDRPLGSLMVPRRDIVVLDVERPWEENLRRIEGSEHTRFPVVKGGLRDILGVISARQMLAKTMRGEPLDLHRELQPPVFVPETLTGMELLQHIRSSGVQLVFVIDEYGEVQGMVTLQDVLEAITGEFKPRNAAQQWAVLREDGSWLLDGLIPIPELQDRLGLSQLPEGARYDTLAGMLLVLFGRVPATGERIDLDRWRFELVDMDGRRIDKVIASARLARESPTVH